MSKVIGLKIRVTVEQQLAVVILTNLKRLLLY